MPNTYNVGAFNQGLQDLGRSLFDTGAAQEAGSKVAMQNALIGERIKTEQTNRAAQELANSQAQAAEALVPGMTERFFQMLNPMIPQRTVQTGTAVPLPPRRQDADALAASGKLAEMIAPDGETWLPGQNPNPALPVSQIVPAVDPEIVRGSIGDMVRLGVNKGDPTKLFSPIVDMIASLMGGYGEEADAFRAAATRGQSTPVGQRYTLPGAEAAQAAQREHDLTKQKSVLDARKEIADQRDATTQRGQDVRAATAVTTNQATVDATTRGQDLRDETTRRGQDMADAAKRDLAGTKGAAGANGTKKIVGIPDTPDAIFKFGNLLKGRIAERNGGNSNVSPETIRSVENEYNNIMLSKPGTSPSAAIELALDAHNFGSEKGWFSNGPVKGELKTGGAAQPQAGRPNAPQATTAPQAKPQGGDLKARAEAAIQQIQNDPDFSDEEKKARIAGVQNKLKQMLGSGQ